MRKIAILLVVLFSLTISFASAERVERETVTSGDFKYALLEDGSVIITWYKGDATSLVIPQEMGGKTVTAIDDQAFSLCDELTSVTIPNSITTIIGNPFNGCGKLTKISVSPDHPSLTIIDGVLFSNTDKRLVTYPCAFNQDNYVIPQGIEIIGTHAFYKCSSLNTITIPDSVTKINYGAFFQCDSLKAISIPNNVSFIDDYAFKNCSSITEIAIPDSVISIGINPFLGCDSLIRISVSSNHPTLSSDNGVLLNTSENLLISCPCALNQNEYSIPQGIVTIGNRAFDNCSALSSVTIPNSVTTIEECAFYQCSNLTDISIPNSITYIGDNAFNYCSSLTSVTIPDSLTAIGFGAFACCASLDSAIIPDSISSIGAVAFAHCTSLSSIVMPKSVISIGENAFYNCPNLIVTIQNNSYAKQYCIDNNLQYTISDRDNSPIKDPDADNNENHKCEVCSREGTHSIIGITGIQEYYCDEHFHELKQMYNKLFE